MARENPAVSLGDVYDFIVIGSGFGGSVSAMRLAEKGYSVLVLERGKRYRDEDFARTNWNIWKYLWLPAIRAYGIQNITFLKDVNGVSMGFEKYRGIAAQGITSNNCEPA